MKDLSHAKKQEQKSCKKKWYRIELGKYSCYIWLLPLVPFVWVYDKWKEYLWNSCQWSEQSAARALDHILPHVLSYDEERDEYYYCKSWGYSGWYFAKYVPTDLKIFCKKFSIEIKEYLFSVYQKNGYKKRVEDVEYVYSQEIYVVFKKIS